MMIFMLLLGRQLSITVDPVYIEASSTSGIYTLTVSETRGKIYDRKLRSLAGGKNSYTAAVIPSAEAAKILVESGTAATMDDYEEKIRLGSPFLAAVEDASIDDAAAGITVMHTETRYSLHTVAPHVVGHLNSEDKGAMGIERAYNDTLEKYSGSLKLRYQINALGQKRSDTEPEIIDSTALSNGGVVLTLDTDVQLVVQEAARRYSGSSAIVVLDADTAQILALCSSPDFSPADVAAALDDENSPLVNRALSSYDVGSVFKLVVAAAALEQGIDANLCCECSGSVLVGEQKFNCSSRSGHGKVNMEAAIAYSCNTYFIELAQQMGAQPILDMARRLGFGSTIELGENYYASSGNLPSDAELSLPAGLANFSFGQGSLQANPVQLAALISCIANDGIYMKPSIVIGEINEKGEMQNYFRTANPVQAMSAKTARTLSEYMRSCVRYGTGKMGASQKITASAKTGSAQTGIIRSGKSVTQAWYAGFFPANEPEYICVVLCEDGESGGATAGPLFKYIADTLYMTANPLETLLEG